MTAETLQELSARVEANADALAAIGFKEWKKRRKMKGLTKEATMTELEQDEQLRKIEEAIQEGNV